jgi:hypothetical protein
MKSSLLKAGRNVQKFIANELDRSLVLLGDATDEELA